MEIDRDDTVRPGGLQVDSELLESLPPRRIDLQFHPLGDHRVGSRQHEEPAEDRVHPAPSTALGRHQAVPLQQRGDLLGVPGFENRPPLRRHLEGKAGQGRRHDQVDIAERNVFFDYHRLGLAPRLDAISPGRHLDLVVAVGNGGHPTLKSASLVHHADFSAGPGRPIVLVGHLPGDEDAAGPRFTARGESQSGPIAVVVILASESELPAKRLGTAVRVGDQEHEADRPVRKRRDPVRGDPRQRGHGERRFQGVSLLSEPHGQPGLRRSRSVLLPALFPAPPVLAVLGIGRIGDKGKGMVARVIQQTVAVERDVQKQVDCVLVPPGGRIPAADIVHVVGDPGGQVDPLVVPLQGEVSRKVGPGQGRARRFGGTVVLQSRNTFYMVPHAGSTGREEMPADSGPVPKVGVDNGRRFRLLDLHLPPRLGRKQIGDAHRQGENRPDDGNDSHGTPLHNKLSAARWAPPRPHAHASSDALKSKSFNISHLKPGNPAVE